MYPERSYAGNSRTSDPFGVNYFWNFSHYDLSLNFEHIIVENVHLSDSLMTLCYRINDNDESNLEE